MSYQNREIPRILVDLSFANRLMLTMFYVLMLTIGYCLMLLVMTFNWPILVVLCAGLLCGHIVFETIGIPKLPLQYRQIAGSGTYLPDSDSCCTKINAACTECPS